MRAAMAMTEKHAGARHLSMFAGGRLLVVALAAAAGLLLVELLRPAAPAEAQVTTAASAGNIIAVAGQVTSDSYGLYLFDRESNIMTVYQWVPGAQKLRLLAARNCTFDLQLDDYKTEPPPKEIRRIVREARSLGNGQ